jgi:hypothetical protein
MDGERFDHLARAFFAAGSRRGLLHLLAGLPFAGVLARFAADEESAARKRKKHKRKNKNKKKRKCKHPPCGGPCTVTSEASALVTETKFNKKPLRLRQRADFENGGRVTEVTLGGANILNMTHVVAAPGMVTTVSYGGAFRGIDQARFATDGVTITGDIDGRAIVPLPSGADPSQIVFADGGAPLSVQGDPDLVVAIQGLFSKAAQQAGACQPTQRKRSLSSRDASSFECIAKHVACAAEAAECEKTVAEIAAGCSFVPILGPIVCGAVGTVNCAYESAECLRKARYSSTCCPVRCGGVVDDLDGPDPLCCESGETCRDPNSNEGRCCAAGMVSCGGECCPAGSCTSGFCCKLPTGSVCGSHCCGPFDACCGGQCCTGTCIGSTCCQLPNYDCGGFCCQGGNACCSGHCCAPGQICRDGQCAEPHPCPRRCSDGQCCPEGKVCCGSPGHCQSPPCIN